VSRVSEFIARLWKKDAVIDPHEIEEHDVVYELLEREGKLLVAFRNHAAFYSIPLSNKRLCSAIREAKTSGHVVFFTHGHCKISKIR
jgi:hypothetical protein